MPSVFIFHGTEGSPEGNWFPWMKHELEAKGWTVTTPRFPTPEGQSLESWLKMIEPYISQIDENTTLIGHSLGGLFLLRFMERLEKPVRAAVFVSASVGVKPIRFYAADERFAQGFAFNWEKIRSSAENFLVYHSDNDPYVSLGNGEKLAEELGAKLTFIPNAGHLNAESGYVTFKKLFVDLQPVLSYPEAKT